MDKVDYRCPSAYIFSDFTWQAYGLLSWTHEGARQGELLSPSSVVDGGLNIFWFNLYFIVVQCFKYHILFDAFEFRIQKL
jgi:hypothetical protein